jgi:(E)-4-hydroxy-3-methylbut-2-enyl-diphosphate synthase
MLKTPLDDTDGCLAELEALKNAGAELVRIAFPDERHKKNLKFLAEKSPVSVMADIHFNHKFALAALESGVSSIRINPGNMTNREGLGAVISAAKANGAVIRIGANGGSLGNNHLASYEDRASALVGAVGEQISLLTDMGFGDIIMSAKSSSVPETIRANLLLSAKYPFPLHIGITEAGGGTEGAVKSAAGLGVLLSQGVGDSVRVSLTGDSVPEVGVAYMILRSLELRKRGVNMISCPGCGRRRVDVSALCERVKAVLPGDIQDGITVAVMGCEVNGPREAASADIGIAGTKSGFVLFKNGTTEASGETADLEKIFSSAAAEFTKSRAAKSETHLKP